MVAKPAGIRTVITGIPSHTGHDASTPRRYFRLGGFTLGNTDGFAPAYPFEYAQQLLYPIPAVWELLAYDIRDGASCLFQELVEVADLTMKQPWDRTPLVTGNSVGGQANGGTAQTTSATYTVPVGRRLVITSAEATIERLTVATAGGTATSDILAGGFYLCEARMYAGPVGNFRIAQASASGQLVNAGQTVVSRYSNSDTGGAVLCRAVWTGYLFDA